VLVGKTDRDTGHEIQCGAADAHVASLHELEAAMPDLFAGEDVFGKDRAETGSTEAPED